MTSAHDELVWRLFAVSDDDRSADAVTAREDRSVRRGCLAGHGGGRDNGERRKREARRDPEEAKHRCACSTPGVAPRFPNPSEGAEARHDSSGGGGIRTLGTGVTGPTVFKISSTRRHGSRGRSSGTASWSTHERRTALLSACPWRHWHQQL